MITKEYNKVVELYADGVYRFILKNIRHEAEAQDVVQDAFAKLWIYHEEVDVLKAKAWLFSTAYRIMIDHIRKNKREIRLEIHHEENQYYSQDSHGTKDMLDIALKQLPEIQRSVILLRDYEGYNYKEIGDITGLNESQVKVYIHRARTYLKTYIEKMESYCHAN